MDLIDAQMFSDVLKSIFGPFLGACFAFYFAASREQDKQTKDDCAAGNVASIVLARQLSDYNKTVTSLEYFEKHALKTTENAHLPFWMRMVPAVPPLFSPELKQDIHSLNFITICPDGPATLQRLINADMKYHYFFAMLDKHSDEMKVAQDRLAASGIDPQAKTAIPELEKVIGHAIVARLNSIVKAIFISIERDKGFFEEAIGSLEKVLIGKFKKGTVVKIRDLQKSLEEDKGMWPHYESDDDA